MYILSLFDGISCGRVALERAGIPITRYYASEIDKYAIQISNKNYPDIIRFGDINHWQSWDINWSTIDLILAGSPCQSFSSAGKRLAFDDPRGQLFFVFVDILNHVRSVNPDVKFLLENVRMKKEHQQVISDHLGVEACMINSSLASAQDRKRLYWFNWKAQHPEDKNILLKDILLPVFSEYYLCNSGWHHWWEKKQFQLQKKYSQICNNQSKAITLTSRMYASWQGNFIDISNHFISKERIEKIILNEVNRRKIGYIGKDNQSNRVYSIHNKSITLTIGSNRTGLYLFGCFSPNKEKLTQNGQRFSCGEKFYTLTTGDRHGVFTDSYIRRLHPIECERLQTLPDNFSEGVSDTQRYKTLGNCWTVDVVTHLLMCLLSEIK